MVLKQEADIKELQISYKGKKLFLERQLELPFDQMATIKTPFKELEVDVEGHSFPNPADKLFYVVDNVSKLQYIINSMAHGKGEMQVAPADHFVFNKLEQLRRASENYVSTNQELKKNDSM